MCVAAQIIRKTHEAWLVVEAAAVCAPPHKQFRKLPLCFRLTRTKQQVLVTLKLACQDKRVRDSFGNVSRKRVASELITESTTMAERE
jgi:hypothetical protein